MDVQGLSSIAELSAASRGFVHVVEESGEYYLYTADYFVAIELPREAIRAFVGAVLRLAGRSNYPTAVARGPPNESAEDAEGSLNPAP